MRNEPAMPQTLGTAKRSRLLRLKMHRDEHLNDPYRPWAGRSGYCRRVPDQSIRSTTTQTWIPERRVDAHKSLTIDFLFSRGITTTPEKTPYRGGHQTSGCLCPAKNGAQGAALSAASQGSLRFGRQRRYPILDPGRPPFPIGSASSPRNDDERTTLENRTRKRLNHALKGGSV